MAIPSSYLAWKTPWIEEPGSLHSMVSQLDTTEHISVQFNCSVVSNYLRHHGLQHARPPCPPPTPGVYSNSCPLSQWCHPTISSSVAPFSSRLQSFPISGSFQMSPALRIRWLKYWSFSFSISLSNEYSRLTSFSWLVVWVLMLYIFVSYQMVICSVSLSGAASLVTWARDQEVRLFPFLSWLLFA